MVNKHHYDNDYRHQTSYNSLYVYNDEYNDTISLVDSTILRTTVFGCKRIITPNPLQVQADHLPVACMIQRNKPSS